MRGPDSPARPALSSAQRGPGGGADWASVPEPPALAEPPLHSHHSAVAQIAPTSSSPAGNTARYPAGLAPPSTPAPSSAPASLGPHLTATCVPLSRGTCPPGWSRVGSLLGPLLVMWQPALLTGRSAPRGQLRRPLPAAAPYSCPLLPCSLFSVSQPALGLLGLASGAS